MSLPPLFSGLKNLRIMVAFVAEISYGGYGLLGPTEVLIDTVSAIGDQPLIFLTR
jgi:hypothetical protein